MTVRRGRLRLRGARFTVDTRVTGRASVRASDGAVRAAVVVTGPDGTEVPVEVRWSERRVTAVATAGGATLTLPAP